MTISHKRRGATPKPHQDELRLKGGKMSKFLGMGTEKQGNIGCIVLLVSFAVMIAAAWLGDKQLQSNALNIVTLTLGYIFGVGASK